MKNKLLPFAAACVAAAVSFVPCAKAEGRADWMAGKRGMMVHWLFAEAGQIDYYANAFDINKFMADFDATKSDYLIFTIGQNKGTYASPNAKLAELGIPSGCCATRDLVGEIAAAVHARGKKFIAYLPCEVNQNDTVKTLLGWSDRATFRQNYCAVIREWALRWGANLDGWWIDGFYNDDGHWPSSNKAFDQSVWADAFRAGNSNAVVTMNPGLAAKTPRTDLLSGGVLSDYLAGEVNSPSALNGWTLKEFADDATCRTHFLMPIDGCWGAYWPWSMAGGANPYGDAPSQSEMYRLSYLGQFPDPVVSEGDLRTMIQNVFAVNGAVTINVGVNASGTLNPKSVALLAKMPGGSESASADPGTTVESLIGSWSSTPMASDGSTFSKDGDLVYAYSTASTDKTVNGITFKAAADPASASADFEFSPAFNTTQNAESDGMSGDLETIARLAWKNSEKTTKGYATMTFKGLTAGKRYCIQLYIHDTWCHNSAVFGPDAKSTVIYRDEENAPYSGKDWTCGGVFTGTITAKGATHEITLRYPTTDRVELNALQVRSLGAAQEEERDPLKPRPALLKRLQDGDDVIGIIHWGPNTYYNQQWGHGNEDPARLWPTNFNPDQIAQACAAGGLKGLVIVAKHHDGTCLWPTATTSHRITESPYRYKGEPLDYVGEMATAIRKAGMKVGIYCSPWDRNNADYANDNYVTTYHNQVKELLTNYGEIFEMWFDGANGGSGYYGGETETTRSISGDTGTYYKFGELFAWCRAKWPNLTIFAGERDDSDFRWPGNEQGYVLGDCRATIVTTGGYINGAYQNGAYNQNMMASGSTAGEYFRVPEADFPMRTATKSRQGDSWFYTAEDDGHTKSAAFLMNRYLNSVGNGATMDIGISPTADGQLSAEDAEALRGFKVIKDAFFAHEVADPTTEPVNFVVMSEDITDGEHIGEWHLRVNNSYDAAHGSAIGYRRMRTFGADVQAPLTVTTKDFAGNVTNIPVSIKCYYVDRELINLVNGATVNSPATDVSKWDSNPPEEDDDDPEQPIEADPDTSWMPGSFGVSFHWTAKIVNDYGNKNWEQAVANFNVKNFADSVESFGAQHVIFTTAHAWQKLPCPCTALDNLISGRTTTRDLLKDIIDELTNRNIRVVFYYNHSCNHDEDQAWDEASGYDAITDAQSMTNFANNICSIVRELSLRYGDGVSAWWFDSASSVDDSQPWPNNKKSNYVAGLRFPWDNLFAAARAGNPHAAIAVNWDVGATNQHDLATDYLSGETEKIDAYGNFFPFAPEGLQDHIWTRMDSNDWFWQGGDVSGYGSRFTEEQLAWWKVSHRDAGRMATLNLVINEAGDINPVVAQRLVNTKTIGKVWVQGRYDPTKWQAAPAASNLILNLTGTCEGNRSQYTDGYHRTPMTVLTDGTVPMTAIVAGANLTNDEKAKIFESLEGNVFTWTLEEASDIYGLNIYSRSSRSQYNGATDGGNDAIVVTKIEVQQSGSSEWTDINAPALTFGKSDGISGGALAAKLVDKSGAPLATGVTAVRFTQGVCENGASLLVEAEVLGCAAGGVPDDPPSGGDDVELGWTAGPMSATGDTLDTRGNLVYAFCRQQSAGWNTSSLTVNDIGFTGIWYTQHENVKIGGESLTTYFEFSPNLNNCSEGLGDENVTGDYGLFLKNGWWYSGSGNVTCTLKRLTAGKTYLVQFVTHWSGGTGRSFWPADDTAKIAYTKSTDCAYGSYLTSVFTATGTTQSFEFAHTGNEFVVNGFQVRELAGGEEPVDPPVPEPPPVYALTIPAKAGLALDSVKTNSIPVEVVNSVYSIVSNTEVTVTFSAASGYELDGDDGVVVKTIVSDYSFVDSDYPAVKEQGGGEDPDDPPSGGDDVELGWTAGPMSATGDTIDTRGKLVYAFCQDGGATGATLTDYKVKGVPFKGAYNLNNTINKVDGKNISDFFVPDGLGNVHTACGVEGVEEAAYQRVLNCCFFGNVSSFNLTLKQLEKDKTYLVQIVTHWTGQSGKKMYAPGSDSIYLQLGGTDWTYGGYLTGVFQASGETETFTISCTGGTGMINAIQVREVTLGGGEDPEEPQPGELVNGRANMKGWAMKRISTASKVASEAGFGWSAGDNPKDKSYSSVTESVMTFNEAQVVNTIQLFAPKSENNTIPQPVDQMPSAFKVYGSNDGSTWTELLSVSGESDWLSMECRYFTFNNTTAYSQCRLSIANTVSGGAAKLGVYNYYHSEPADPSTPWVYANNKLSRGDQELTMWLNGATLQVSGNVADGAVYDLDFTAGIVDGDGNPLSYKVNLEQKLQNNKDLTRLVGGHVVSRINGWGCQNCWYLNELSLGEVFTGFADRQAFENNYSLEWLDMESAPVETLPSNTFTCNYNLKGDLVLHVKTFSSKFNGSRITSITLDEVVTYGDNNYFAPFEGCTFLTNITLGANLTTINCKQAFGKISVPVSIYWNSAPPQFTQDAPDVFNDKNFIYHKVTSYLPLSKRTEWEDFAGTVTKFALTLPPAEEGAGTWYTGNNSFEQLVYWRSEDPPKPSSGFILIVR